MTRWKVRKENVIFWDEDDEVRYAPRWHVTSPTGVSFGGYATYSEAMARADKQSRTVTVTLPRGAERLSLPKGKRIELRPDGGGDCPFRE